MSDLKYGKGDEAEALKQAIRELSEAQKIVHTALISEKLEKVSKLLATVQV
ncbi:hypothetical protein [Sinorhizobium meliloti]|uniref:hypothetical protein n=1 Tax=Rhizobium meliloti TaxID=382 RepID=UPI0013E3D17F|nr:hypothetical protein [Sinorhizobium meliloti]QND35824.1 hypothetical protein HB772_29425 [Sinorhizobium meliloti]WQP09286.1 hypothetical protein U8C39_38075 [Sinorhizobium meliloti]WQP22912.1 hypothetical protein U8C33_39060 [Sinorhizobium meliloti]WQP35946.1 hypothetical protein U8C45_36850 [Sinorhizobium meliloti]